MDGAVAMMRFVVYYQDVICIPQIRQDPSHKGLTIFWTLFYYFGPVIFVYRGKIVPVGDEYLCLQQVLPHGRIDQNKTLVKIIFVFRQKDLQSFTDGNAWRDYQDMFGKSSIFRICYLI